MTNPPTPDLIDKLIRQLLIRVVHHVEDGELSPQEDVDVLHKLITYRSLGIFK